MLHKEIISNENKYLIFRIDSQHFAISVSIISEVIEAQKVTIVPRSPEYLRGVINLRGDILPVADIRRLLNLPHKPDDTSTAFLIANVAIDEHHIHSCIVVDAMNDVIDADQLEILPAPEIGIHFDTELLNGMFLLDHSYVFILDLPLLLRKAVFAKTF